MAYQSKDAVFLVLFFVCLNVIYNSVTTDAATLDTSTTNINATPDLWNISCISDKFTSPSCTDQLLHSSMMLSAQYSSFLNTLMESENSSTPYSETILTNSDNSMSLFILEPSHSISSEESSQLSIDHLSNSLTPYSETILTNSDNSMSSFILEPSHSISSEESSQLSIDHLSNSSTPYSETILTNSDNSMSSLILEPSHSISSEESSQLSIDHLSNSLTPYSETILANSDNSMSSFILEPSHSISSEESSQLWIDQLSNSLMFLSTQDYSLVSNLIGSQYSSIQHTPTDLLKDSSSCILKSCDTSVHFLPTSAQSATYLISSLPTSTLPSEVSPSFRSITNTPFSSSQRSAFSSVTLTNLVTAPTSSTPTKQQTTSTVGETVIYPTFKPLAVFEITFVFILDGDFATFEASNQKDKLKEQLEKQLLDKIFKNTELREVHVSNFSKGSIACHTLCKGQVQNATEVDKNLDVILENTLANAKSISTSFGVCDTKETMDRIRSSINTYKANPEKYVQYNCPKSYNYHKQDGECHHACENKGIEFCGPKGECVFSGTENVAVCQCSEESLYIYHGDKCEQKTPKLTFYLAVSLGVGGGVVIILLITIICVVCRRIRLKKSLKAADDDSEKWSLPNEHVAMKNLSFRLSKKPANLYYRPTGQMNKAYESIIAPDEVILPMYFPPERNSSNSRHEDDIESRRESLKNVDTSQKYSIRRPKVSMEPNDLFHSVKAGPRI